MPHVGGRTLIMGVLNATPDSFSDGGMLSTPELAVARARELIEAGADILDLGGESTRPGAAAVNIEEELRRILPVITALRRTWPEFPLSIDTYKADVADAAIEAGADVINDVWGLMHGVTDGERARWRAWVVGNYKGVAPFPSRMARVVAARKCPVILMHNRPRREYGDFWDDVLLDLKTSLAIADEANIDRSQIWLDPGFGFAKSVGQNLAVLRDLSRICALGLPVLVGTSRKSTIGTVLNAEVDDRLEGTGATVVWAIQQGCQMIRVHDVREMIRYARMADAIKLGPAFPTA